MNSTCPKCLLKNFRLVDEKGIAFVHDQISLTSYMNIKILSSTAMNQTFYLEGYIDSSTQLECS